jgi:hypothetical protein
VFLGDRLYGITRHEHLVFLDMSYDNDGVPMATSGECVIGEGFHVWNNEEYYDDNDDDDDDDDDDDKDNDDDDLLDANDVVADDGDHGFDVHDDSSHRDDEYESNDDEDYDEIEDDDQHTYDLTKTTEDDVTLKEFDVMNVDDHEIKPSISMMWYLIESRGKLLMVRRQVLRYKNLKFTHKVEVFEADMSAPKWVLLEGGLGGHAFFISRRFCKSISAACSKKIQEDAIYFIDTDDVFDMRSKTISAPRKDWQYIQILRYCDPNELTWVFPQS